MEFKKQGSYKTYYNNKGDQYFNFKGRRYYLDNIQRAPEFYPGFIHGILNIFTCNCYSIDLYINLDQYYSDDKIIVYTLVKSE